MNDTSAEMAQKFDQLMRTRSAGERFRMVSEMFDTARRLAKASFPPGLSDIELREYLSARFYSSDVDVAAYGQALRRRL